MTALSSQQLMVLGDEIEAAAFEDMYRAADGVAGLPAGIAALHSGDLLLLQARGIPTSLFNRVIGVGLHRRVDDAQLADLTAHYQALGARDYWLHVTPTSFNQDLASRLRALGYAPPARRSWARMRHDGPLAEIPGDLVIRAARREESTVIGQVATQAFGMPPFMEKWLAALVNRPQWLCLVAEDRTRIVGVGMLYTRGDAAWLGVGGVLPTHRRRGAHANLMLARVRAARDAGCGHVFTETGEPIGDEPNPSLANMRRCGFVQLCSRLNFAGPPGGT